MRPFGEVVISPFEVRHTDSELSKLARRLQKRTVRHAWSWRPQETTMRRLQSCFTTQGYMFPSSMRSWCHGYGNNDLRRVKTDRKDAVKLANYGLDRWLTLPRYIPEEDTRLLLKNCYRQYRQYSKVQTILKNNLISLLDTVFPNVNRLFSSPARADGSEKWVDFVAEFWHCRCVSEKSEKVFTTNTSVGAENTATISARKSAHHLRRSQRAHWRYAKIRNDKATRGAGCCSTQSDFCCACCTQTRNAIIGFHAAGISRCHGYVRA